MLEAFMDNVEMYDPNEDPVDNTVEGGEGDVGDHVDLVDDPDAGDAKADDLPNSKILTSSETFA